MRFQFLPREGWLRAALYYSIMSFRLYGRDGGKRSSWVGGRKGERDAKGDDRPLRPSALGSKKGGGHYEIVVTRLISTPTRELS